MYKMINAFPLLLTALALMKLHATLADICGCNYNKDRTGYAMGNQGTFPSNTLQNASAEQNLAAVKQLLQSHTDPNAVESKLDMTPLHAALPSTSDPYWHPYTDRVYSVIKALLGAGANPNIPIPTSSGLVESPYYPLSWVAYDGRNELARMMVEAGTPADVNAKDAKGQTALHQAAKCDFRLSSDDHAAATATYLIGQGADPSIKDNSGQTPFDVTPGKEHNCTTNNSDSSDCPLVCQVLLNAIRGIPSKAVPSSDSSAPQCCPQSGNQDQAISQCCV